ncbi:FtsK/SpoIIIE domain-containing protein [Nocardioides sp.]|uniref:FtsK/SpoIIIE domain-containing protein n=1 Tax=Nocardioides sp. TaxID=35761 RepID=UPI002C9AE68C|nr:FtsK/SpoIIIE domain-containing protein [Nocardioides sp.]HSX66544.1 FtsK/SpoIIIE domain-containing protein [Nocardioides sp.]
MKLKLTLQRPQAEAVDVTITVDSTATAHDVARHLVDVDPGLGLQAGPDDLLTLAVAAPDTARLIPLESGIPMGEAPIGSGFMAQVVNLGPASAQGRRRGGDAIAVLRVLEGPSRGQEFPLRAGLSSIGRADDNDIVLSDPMVSKRHARLDVGSVIELVDLNSANGVLVDGVPVQRWQVVSGAPFVIGDTTLVAERTTPDFATPDAILERGGGLLFNRSPRVEERYPGTVLKMPNLPKESFKKLFPWMMLIAPLLMSAAMYLMTGRPRTLMMLGMTPLMMMMNHLNQRRMMGGQEEHQLRLFERQYEELEEKLFYAKPEEELARNREVPPVAEVFEQSMKLGPMLWTRRPEHWNFLAVRLGVGRLPARNAIFDGPEAPDGLPEYVERVDKLRERYRYVDDVPLVETLESAGSIGVAGPRGAAADAMRGLAVQIFGLHAPNDVVAVAFTGAGWRTELEWLKWLPHTTSETSPFREQPLSDSAPTAAALLGALEAHVARVGKPAEPRGPHRDDWNPNMYGADVNRAVGEDKSQPPVSVVVFVTEDAPVDRARLVSLLERGPDCGVHAVFVGSTVEALPASCRTFVDVSEGLDKAEVGLVRSGERHVDTALEGVSNDYMLLLARHLAPVVDASVVVHDSSDIPNSVALLALTGQEIAEDPAAVVERWRQNNTLVDRSSAPRPRLKKAGNLRAIVGQGVSDAMSLDLRSQGPHALVGGTTGAGKSEFLQGWVLGMASAHSPDRVTFLFVDYKGGSAFADCVELPHCVGLVTDLSPHLVRRALTSLRAELHHREHLFNRKKVKDLLELEKRQDPETPPALVLVIDEFAALAGEVPEFVDGVVDIAQRGRSLGIHLIMATQRPAGVIKDNLRANTNLRVALRMADENDSEDVVGDPVAARFPASIPGRAIAKTGHSSLIPFQSAYAGGWTGDVEDPAEIAVSDLRFGTAPIWESPHLEESDFHDADLGPNDQRRIVDNLIAASQVAGLMRPRRPWLEDLPEVIDLESLPNEGDGQIPFALVDVPEKQSQEPVTFDPDRDGSMVVFGTSGSGKSTLLRTLAVAAGSRPERGNVNVYCLDFASGGLSVLSRLPHVGSIVDGEDVERITRLLLTLDAEMDRRSAAFGAVNAGDLTQYRLLADATTPRILLLVDNFAEFKKDWEYQAVRQPAYRAFLRILSEGRQLGLHAVLTADRSNAIPTAVAANIQRRVILRLADQNQYMMIGVPKDILDDQAAAGRAIVDKHEAQVAVIGGTANTAEQAGALDALAARLRAAGVDDLPEIGALPTKAPIASFPATVDGMPAIGLADDTLAPCGFDPVGCFVVTGPPASGKTNMMKAMIIAVERFDPDVQLYHFGGRRAELKDFRPWVKSASREEEAKELAEELAALLVDDGNSKRIMIVIEEVPHLGDGAAERASRLMFKAVRDSDHLLIGDADVSRATGALGVLGDWKQSRQGIVLKPDQYDGDSIFKTSFGKIKRGDSPVGRGFFVQGGRVRMVQTPFVD